MDLWIPQIGGEKAIRLMQENDGFKHIPVVLFSANDEIEKISEKINASAYLKKPFDIHSFKGIIETYVS
jgi:DNA-binding NtrC family response regulator